MITVDEVSRIFSACTSTFGSGTSDRMSVKTHVFITHTEPNGHRRRTRADRVQDFSISAIRLWKDHIITLQRSLFGSVARRPPRHWTLEEAQCRESGQCWTEINEPVNKFAMLVQAVLDLAARPVTEPAKDQGQAKGERVASGATESTSRSRNRSTIVSG